MDAGFRRSPGWLFVLAMLVVAQAWLTLHLYGGGNPIATLTSDAPIISGKHSLHYYHGLLGNRVWHERKTMTCYDPSFQAGYLKTPIFDAGSRPAELFLIIGGASAASYKIGLAICCLLAPLAFALAARGINMSPPGACLAALIGGTLWWSPPSRALLEAGDLDLMIGGMCIPIYLTWMGRYGRTPGPLEWIVMTAAAGIGWFTAPLLMLGVVPLAFLYHVWQFWHVRFIWHLGLLSSTSVAFASNLFWLGDWGMYLWMYVPYGGEESPARLWPNSLEEWRAFLPSDPADIGIGVVGLLGLVFMLRRRLEMAWLLGMGTLVFVVAAGAGRLWPMVAEFGTHKVMSIGVWCLAVPCAYLLSELSSHIGRSSGFRPVGPIWLAIGLVGAAWAFEIPKRWQVAPLEIGLKPTQETLIQMIREKSMPEGRILWEDRAIDPSHSSGWSALLPELTQRSYLGGLSPDVCVDHLQIHLGNGKLVGKSLEDWTDQDLKQFFARYNVTRIICRTAESNERFKKVKGIASIAEFPEEGGTMYAIDRTPSYFVKGEGEVVQMDWKRVALNDLKPDESGVVVLSLHHHANWRVTPGYVTIERDIDITDPIPLIRLRLPGPVARVTMTWKSD
jgi:hypothetical protein